MAGCLPRRRRRLKPRPSSRSRKLLERSSLSDSNPASYAASASADSEHLESSIKVLLTELEQLKEDYSMLRHCLVSKGLLSNGDLAQRGSRRPQASTFQSFCRSPTLVRAVAEALGPANALAAVATGAAAACRFQPGQPQEGSEVERRVDGEDAGRRTAADSPSGFAAYKEPAATPRKSGAETGALVLHSSQVPGNGSVSSRSALPTRLFSRLLSAVWRAEEILIKAKPCRNLVMALRLSAFRQKWTYAMPRDLIAPSAVVNADRPNDVIRQFNALKRMARQNGAIQKAARTVRREFPTNTRQTNRMNQVYYAKWHYMKYCTQVIQYSMRKGLRLRADIEDESSIAQKQLLGNVRPSPLGSGRFRENEWNAVSTKKWQSVQKSHEEAGDGNVDDALSRAELERLLDGKQRG